MVRWWHLIIPIRVRYFKLGQFETVVVGIKPLESEEEAGSRYPVSMAGKEVQTLEICSPKDELESRRLAKAISEFLNLPLVDLTDMVESRIEPHQLHEPAPERLGRLSALVQIKPPPANMRSIFEIHEDWIVVTLSKETLEAGPGTFSLKSKGLWKQEQESLKLEEIIEIKLERAPGSNPDELMDLVGLEQRHCLAIVGKRQILRFGVGLSREELLWLREMVLKAVYQ